MGSEITRVFVVERDPTLFDFWKELFAEELPEARLQWFESPTKAARSTVGEPKYLILNLDEETHGREAVVYLKAAKAIRDRFPDAELCIVCPNETARAALREQGLAYLATAPDYFQEIMDEILLAEGVVKAPADDS